MTKGWKSRVAAGLAAMFIAQPTLGAALYSFDATEQAPERIIIEKGEAAPPSVDDQRYIEQQLIDLGRDPVQARQMASLLTAEDLAVLLGNPGMMQEAGDLTTQQKNMAAGVLFLVGFIALAYAADGSIVQN